VVRDGETFERAIRELQDQPALTFDFETSGLAWYRHARACGIALGCWHQDGRIQNYYVPFRHQTGEQQLDINLIGPALKGLLERPTLKVGHHLKFDYHIAWCEGWYPQGPRYDVMIGAQFYDENRLLALKERAITDLGISTAGYWEGEVDKEIVRLAKQHRLGKDAYRSRYGYAQVPVELCGIYACHDVEFATLLWGFYERNKVSTNYPRVFQTEQDLVEVLVELEHTGIPVDTHYMVGLRDRVSKARDELGQQVEHWLMPHRVDIASDDELRRYLTGVLRLPLHKFTKTKKLSVDREALEEFKDVSPVIPLIMEWRDANKIATTYTGSILDRVDTEKMLHCNLKQVGTNTGRLACADPNLQNLPTDDDERTLKLIGVSLKDGGIDPWSVKRGFQVPNGMVRLFADYSQIELRVLAYYTGDPIMHDVYRTGGDIHERTSLEVFGKSGLNDDSIRRPAKVINFGLSYCLSAKGLARQAKMSIDKAEAFMDRFFQRYAGIAKYRPYFWNECRRHGNQFVNRFGRPRRVWNLTAPEEFDRARAERQAIGSLVQGTAAELTKESMVRIHRWIKANNITAYMRLTVHDEIQVDVPIESWKRVAKAVKALMEDYPEFAPIPIVVDIAMSTTTWAEKKKIKSFD
jgi:DNA polymerase-1